MVLWFKVHALIIIAKIITSLLKLSNQIGPKALVFGRRIFPLVKNKNSVVVLKSVFSEI